jgi:integrase/recombinase XerD
VNAGIEKPGSVHIFRHTMATLMHDAGADIRDLQEILWHAQLSTTEIYTHVSIDGLKAIHTRTHPAHLVHANSDFSSRASASAPFFSC